jgi:hypothetical protein
MFLKMNLNVAFFGERLFIVGGLAAGALAEEAFRIAIGFPSGFPTPTKGGQPICFLRDRHLPSNKRLLTCGSYVYAVRVVTTESFSLSLARSPSALP